MVIYKTAIIILAVLVTSAIQENSEATSETESMGEIKAAKSGTADTVASQGWSGLPTPTQMTTYLPNFQGWCSKNNTVTGWFSIHNNIPGWCSVNNNVF